METTPFTTSMRQRATTLLATLLLAVSLSVVSSVATAPPAAAATCGGTLIKHLPIKNDAGTRTLAWLDVYWNASTKRNCAMTRHSDLTWGRTARTSVSIVRCEQVNPGNGCDFVTGSRDQDSGYYKYYAGPVSVWSGSHCIFALGYIQWGSNNEVYHRSFQGACS